MEPAEGLFRRSIRVRLADRPGSLHQLTEIAANADVNIVRLEVVSWEAPDVWDDVEMAATSDLQLDAVVGTLKRSGMAVIGLPRSWAMRDWAVEVLRILDDLAKCPDESGTLERFAEAAAELTQTSHAFVLMDPSTPNSASALTRWELLHRTAVRFDPDEVRWSGDPRDVRSAVSAMRAARAGVTDVGAAVGVIAATVPLHTKGRRRACLAVVGERPPFLPPELTRLELFSRVGAPHISHAGREACA